MKFTVKSLHEKTRIEELIVAEKERYLDAIHKLLSQTPCWYVKQSGKKIRGYYQPVFIDKFGGLIENFPEGSGIYLVYRKERGKPFYCGEADNLRKRVSFHFKDSKSIRNFSTLKCKLPKSERRLLSMSKKLKLRVITVPFGRKDVESFLHDRYKINTKSRRAFR
jgi:hypothetical protein